MLDTGDGRRIQLVLCAVFVQGDVDLAGAEDYAIDFIVGEDGIVIVGGVRDDPLEVGLASEVFDGGAGERVAQKGFGEEEDEGLMISVSAWVKTEGEGDTYASGIGGSFDVEGYGTGWTA